RFAALGPQFGDHRRNGLAAAIDRYAIEAELEMAGASEMCPGFRMLDLALDEETVLLQQRGDVPDGPADRHDEARIREELQQVFEARDVVVRVGEVAHALAQEEELADMRAQERFEFRMGCVLRECLVPETLVEMR